MKNLLKVLSFGLIMAFFFSGCSNTIESIKIDIGINKKQHLFAPNEEMYTQCNMHAYRGRVDTVNYGVGIFIPANSKVTLLESNSNKIKFLYKGKTITLLNKEKYSGLDIEQIFHRYFGKKKVDLNKFTKKEKKAIKSGRVIKGMSKKAVLVALGHPPAHATPSLESDEWKYWKSRWNTMIVIFKNGKVVSIKD